MVQTPMMGLITRKNQTTVIDVLVTYTPESGFPCISEKWIPALIRLFNVANKIFADSKTGILIRPVGSHEVSYAPADNLFSDLAEITFQSDDAFASLQQRRELFGGDLGHPVPKPARKMESVVFPILVARVRRGDSFSKLS